jgi:hypothetical protein
MEESKPARVLLSGGTWEINMQSNILTAQDCEATQKWTQLTSRYSAIHAPEDKHCAIHWIEAVTVNTPLTGHTGPLSTAQILETHQEHEEFIGLQISVHPQIRDDYHPTQASTQEILYGPDVRVLRHPHHPTWRLHLINGHWILTEPISNTIPDQNQAKYMQLAGSGGETNTRTEARQSQTTQFCRERRHLRLTRPQLTTTTAPSSQAHADRCEEPFEVFVQN